MSRRGVIVDRTGRSVIDETGRCVIGRDKWDLTIIVSENLVGDVLDVEIIEVGELTAAAVASAIAAVRRRGPIDRLSTISEYLLIPVAELRRAYGIAGHSVEYAQRLRDKWFMKAQARMFGIRHNAGILASDVMTGKALPAWEAGYVVKPRAESGSRGVRVFATWPDALDAVAALDDRSNYLIELFNDAEVLHIDGFIVDGHTTMEVSRYVRPCHTTGRGVPLSSVTVDDEETRGAATSFMSDVLQAWGIRNDVFHCEIFADEEGLTLCEIAGRPGGAGVPAVFSATKGVDLRHAKLRLDFGLDPNVGSVAPIARHGGWTVIHPSSPDRHEVDDSGLSGHHTRCVLSPSDPWIDGFAGVGVATYSFADESTDRVLALIDRYELGVRVVPSRSQSETIR